MNLDPPHLIADMIGLPDWAPKALRNGAAVILLLTLYLMPSTFGAGLELWSQSEAQRAMRALGPLLHDMTIPGTHGAPVRGVGSGHSDHSIRR